MKRPAAKSFQLSYKSRVGLHAALFFRIFLFTLLTACKGFEVDPLVNANFSSGLSDTPTTQTSKCSPTTTSSAPSEKLSPISKAFDKFIGNKILVDIPAGTPIATKVSASADIPKGSYSILIKRSCMTQQDASNLSDLGVDLNTISEDMDLQSVDLNLTQNTNRNWLTTLVNNNPCIIAMTENFNYRLNALSVSDSEKQRQSFHDSAKTYRAYDRFNASFSSRSPANAADVIVAVIDTGIDPDHPDLKNNLLTFPQGPGYDSINRTYDPRDIDSKGHGTHVAGLVAAEANNGIGGHGVAASGVKIMAIKAFELDSQGASLSSTSAVTNGILFAIENGAQVINMSLGGNVFGFGDPLYLSTIQMAVEKGVFVLAAAGNDGMELTENGFNQVPALYGKDVDGFLNIGSIDSANNRLSSFSNRSTTYVELAATGATSSRGGVYSTVPTWLNTNGFRCSLRDGYGCLAGTSMASPVAAGAAALAISYHQRLFGKPPLPAKLEKAMKVSAVTNPSLNSYVANSAQLDLDSLLSTIESGCADVN